MKYILGFLLASSLLFNNVEASIPKCSDCSVYATGKDGTLWGWEDDSFCRLSSSCSSDSKKTTKKTSKKTTTKKSTTTKKDSTTTKKATTVVKFTTTIAPTSSAATSSASSAAASSTVASGTTGATKTVNAAAAANHKKDSSGNLICNNCNVNATGGDGVFWGWEDNATCIIDKEKCKLSTNEPQTSTNKPQRGSDGILICSTCEYTRIDEDKTTWNTENGEECRVIGSRCNFNKTPHPWCSGCVVTATGGDGALYGWENNNSCLINEIDCGLIENSSAANNTGKVNGKINGNSKVEIESSALQAYASIYYIVATLVTIFIVRGF